MSHGRKINLPKVAAPSAVPLRRVTKALADLASAPFFKPTAKLRTLKVPFKLPVSDQRLLITLPEVRRYIVWKERCLIVRAALVLMQHGLSLRRAAFVLGISTGTLFNYLALHRENGMHGLRPKAYRSRDATDCQLVITLK